MIKNVEITKLPGLVRFDLEDPSLSHDELVAALEQTELRTSDIFPDLEPSAEDHRLSVHNKIRTRQARGPQEEEIRDVHAPDHIFHMDGTGHDYDNQPLATLIIAREVGAGAPATTFVSTTALYELAHEVGVFEAFDPLAVQALFSDSTYYVQAKPYFMALGGPPETMQRLRDTTEQDFRKFRTQFGDYAALKQAIDELHTPKLFDFVQNHPITGDKVLFMDAGCRHERLVSDDFEAEVLNAALYRLRVELLGNLAFMNEAMGAVETIVPASGRGVAFTQKGLLHAAQAGNDITRDLSVIGLLPEIAYAS